mmetsp:Transcript_46554/g.149490  ORF Transcript_46554/g.149490 Transcript_46554/m.149490 type:complete len:226 (+) Transcript_46554:143-820(+)
MILDPRGCPPLGPLQHGGQALDARPPKKLLQHALKCAVPPTIPLRQHYTSPLSSIHLSAPHPQIPSLPLAPGALGGRSDRGPFLLDPPPSRLASQRRRRRGVGEGHRDEQAGARGQLGGGVKGGVGEVGREEGGRGSGLARRRGGGAPHGGGAEELERDDDIHHGERRPHGADRRRGDREGGEPPARGWLRAPVDAEGRVEPCLDGPKGGVDQVRGKVAKVRLEG